MNVGWISRNNKRKIDRQVERERCKHCDYFKFFTERQSKRKINKKNLVHSYSFFGYETDPR